MFYSKVEQVGQCRTETIAPHSTNWTSLEQGKRTILERPFKTNRKLSIYSSLMNRLRNNGCQREALMST